MGQKLKRKIKRFAFITVLLLLVFAGYVEIANRHSVNMTYRQKVLKAVYPVWMWWSKLWGSKNTSLTEKNREPMDSFYELGATLNNGDTLDFSTLRGKKVLIVNTASDCGFTGQYAELEQLQARHPEDLVILAFPANDFKEQEKGTDAQIAEFCRTNFNISFPLMKKSRVVRGEEQHPVYSWLTNPSRNGWNSKEPVWNFSKYIVNENGRLTHFFGPTVSPLDQELTTALSDKE